MSLYEKSYLASEGVDLAPIDPMPIEQVVRVDTSKESKQYRSEGGPVAPI